MPHRWGRGRRWAHPRSRGENIKAAVSVVVEWGSSPLTRGKRHDEPIGLITDGLIPAHAGKTREGVQVLGKAGAHPRSRGENDRPGRFRRVKRGSSPLTRGKLGAPTVGVIKVRLIPAHAGKTGCQPRVRHLPWAHPRSRGENLKPARAASARTGSSPLTRGKRRSFRPSCRSRGLIPAHAGKTPMVHASRSHLWAHPRSRGENTS